MRRKLSEKYGKNSRKFKKMMKLMRSETTKLKKEIVKKNDEKIEHLAKKYNNISETVIPEKLMRYKDLSIFSEKESDKDTDEKEKVTVIGEVTPELEEDELSVLRLPPNFAVMDKLNKEDFELDTELCFTKKRWNEINCSDENEDKDEI